MHAEVAQSHGAGGGDAMRAARQSHERTVNQVEWCRRCAQVSGPVQDVDQHVEVRAGMGFNATVGTYLDHVGVELSLGEVELSHGPRIVRGAGWVWVGGCVNVADQLRQFCVDEAGDPNPPRSATRPSCVGGICPARFEVLPVVGAGVAAVEFLPKMFRIVTVDQHE